MNTIEWISLLSSIGALITAIIAACTLLELFRQRKSSYKPDLCVLNNSFQLRSSKTSDVELATEWGKQNEEECALLFDANMAVVNIGFGAAKNVTAKWIYDKEKLLNEVNDLAQKTHQPFYIEKSKHMLSINNKGIGQYMVNAHMDSVEFEYLLPLSHDNTGRKVGLPPSYTLLVSTYLSLQSYNNAKFDELNIPHLSLELSYSDIGKGKLKTKHKIECRVTSIITRKDGLASEFGVLLSEIS